VSRRNDYFAAEFRSPLVTNESYNESELLRRVAGGEEAAFRQLFSLLIRPLVYFATQLTASRQEGEDIASNAFRKLWERHAGFRSMAEIRGFLYTTARNECLNLLRHRKVQSKAQRELLHLLDQEPQWADARKVQSELLQLIHAEINSLPAHHREMVVMSFMEELTTEEIAARLGISTAHARTNKARAIAQLRTALLKKGLLEAALLLWSFKY
jgi:RNA polymerase sigma-70 factor (ECF subfamily)